MLESITLKEVPFDWDDEEAINYNGVGGDYNFEIIANKTYTIGNLYISKEKITANGINCPVYVEWIEFLSVFRHKRLFGPVLDAIYDRFGEFYLESSEKANPIYHKIGCESLGYDDITELEIFKYRKREK